MYLKKYNLREEYDGTVTTVMGVHFPAGEHHFIDDKIVLKCTSSMFSLYWVSVEVSQHTIKGNIYEIK